jgi:hypothetical protein
LDGGRPETRCFHPQHRSSVAPPRADETVAAANRVLKHYGMTLADWQGSAFILSTATGKTEIVDNLVHLWTAVERLLGRPCDPLDAALISLLERELA